MDKEKIKDFFIELFKFLLSIINYILIVACDPYENYHIFCGTLYLFVLSAAIESLEMMLDGIDKKNKIAFGFSFIAFAVYGSLCIIIGFLFAIDEKNMIGLKLYHFVIYIVVGRLVLFIDILIKIISYEEGLWYVVQGIWDFFMCCCNRLVSGK